MLRQTSSSSPKASLSQFLDNQRYEGNEKDNEDRDDTTEDPIKDGSNVGTPSWEDRIRRRLVSIIIADDGFVSKCSQIDETDHEHLDREDDEQVVDVEAGVSIVEREETIQW